MIHTNSLGHCNVNDSTLFCSGIDVKLGFSASFTGFEVDRAGDWTGFDGLRLYCCKDCTSDSLNTCSKLSLVAEFIYVCADAVAEYGVLCGEYAEYGELYGELYAEYADGGG